VNIEYCSIDVEKLFVAYVRCKWSELFIDSFKGPFNDLQSLIYVLKWLSFVCVNQFEHIFHHQTRFNNHVLITNGQQITNHLKDRHSMHWLNSLFDIYQTFGWVNRRLININTNLFTFVSIHDFLVWIYLWIFNSFSFQTNQLCIT